MYADCSVILGNAVMVKTVVTSIPKETRLILLVENCPQKRVSTGKTRVIAVTVRIAGSLMMMPLKNLLPTLVLLAMTVEVVVAVDEEGAVVVDEVVDEDVVVVVLVPLLLLQQQQLLPEQQFPQLLLSKRMTKRNK